MPHDGECSPINAEIDPLREQVFFEMFSVLCFHAAKMVSSERTHLKMEL